LEEHLAPAHRALGGAAEAAWAAGRALALEQAIAEAVADPTGEGGSAIRTTPAVGAAPPGRSGAAAGPSGPLRVDGQTYTVWRGAQPLPRPLSAQEFALARYLYERCERVCTRQELGDAVWGADAWDLTMLYRLVRRVKEKLEPRPDRPRYLQTVRGIGYRLVP
jgi:DNA-binding response OmpR family regulator